MRCSWLAVWGCASAACGRVGFQARPATDGGGPADVRDAVTDARAIAPPVFVQHAAGFSSVMTGQVSLTNPVAAGDLIVVGVDFDGTTDTTLVGVTDDLGDAYALVGPDDGATSGGNVDRQYIAYTIAGGSGAAAVTATLGAAPATHFEIRLHEYTDVAVTDPLDGHVTASGAMAGSDAATTPPLVTSEPNELVFGMVVDGTVASGTGFVGRGSDFGDVTEDAIAPTPGAYPVRASPTGSWVATGVAFRGR